MSEFGVEASVAQDAVTSTLSEIAFVIDLNTRPDEVPPTWKSEMMSPRLTASLHNGTHNGVSGNRIAQ